MKIFLFAKIFQSKFNEENKYLKQDKNKIRIDSLCHFLNIEAMVKNISLKLE